MRPSEAPPAQAIDPAARQAILLLSLAGFTAGISLRFVEPMLPKLAQEFGSSVSAASVIVTAFGLAYAGAVLVQGPLGDRLGKLRVVTLAMLLTGASSMACAAAWDIGSLAALRFVMGVFASGSIGLGMAYIGDAVPLAQRQHVIANFIAGSILGQTLGPLFGGIFTDWAGWRLSFVVLGLVFLFTAVVLYSRTAATWPAPRTGNLRLLPVYRDLLSRKAVLWLCATGVTETFFFFGAYVFLGAFLKHRYDLSYTLIGLVLAGYGVGGLLYTASFRPLIRLLGERGLVTGGGVLGCLMFVAVALAPHWGWAVPGVIGLGLAFYMLHNTMQVKATEVAPDARGAGMALYACTWATGQATGVAAMGLLVSLFDYAAAIAAFGVGWGLLGLWLRGNLARFKP